MIFSQHSFEEFSSFLPSDVNSDVFRTNTEEMKTTKKVILIIIRRITAIKLVSSADWSLSKTVMKPYKRHKRHETIAVTFIRYKNATYHYFENRLGQTGPDWRISCRRNSLVPLLMRYIFSDVDQVRVGQTRITTQLWTELVICRPKQFSMVPIHLKFREILKMIQMIAVCMTIYHYYILVKALSVKP